MSWTFNLPSNLNRTRNLDFFLQDTYIDRVTIQSDGNGQTPLYIDVHNDKIAYNFFGNDDVTTDRNLNVDHQGVLIFFKDWVTMNPGQFTVTIDESDNYSEASITINGETPWRSVASAGGDPVIKPFFGSGYKVKLPDLPGHVYRLLQGGGVTINTEIMACPADKASFLQTRPVLFSDQKIIEGTYIGKILIDVKDISFRHTVDLSQGIGSLECNLPDGASWDGDLTDGEIKQGFDPEYKGKYKQRVMSVGGGVMKFVVRIYEHPQVQNEFQVLRCNIDPSVHDGLLMRNYKPKLFFLNDLYDTRILSKHKKNSNPLTFRHPVLKNQVTMKCA